MSDTPVVERMDSAVFTLSTDVAETDGALTVKRMGVRGRPVRRLRGGG